MLQLRLLQVLQLITKAIPFTRGRYRSNANKSYRGQTTKTGGSDPTFSAFSRPKSSWGRSRPSRRKRDRVLPACRSRKMQAVTQDVRQNQPGKGEGNYGNRQGTTQTTKVGGGSGSGRRVGERTARSVCEVHRLHTVLRHHGGAEGPVQA